MKFTVSMMKNMNNGDDIVIDAYPSIVNTYPGCGTIIAIKLTDGKYRVVKLKYGTCKNDGRVAICVRDHGVLIVKDGKVFSGMTGEVIKGTTRVNVMRSSVVTVKGNTVTLNSEGRSLFE